MKKYAFLLTLSVVFLCTNLLVKAQHADSDLNILKIDIAGEKYEELPDSLKEWLKTEGLNELWYNGEDQLDISDKTFDELPSDLQNWLIEEGLDDLWYNGEDDFDVETDYDIDVEIDYDIDVEIDYDEYDDYDDFDVYDYYE